MFIDTISARVFPIALIIEGGNRTPQKVLGPHIAGTTAAFDDIQWANALLVMTRNVIGAGKRIRGKTIVLVSDHNSQLMLFFYPLRNF